MRYLFRRAGFYLIALWAAVTFNFIIPRLMPGDPAEAYIAKLQTQQVTRAQIDAIRHADHLRPPHAVFDGLFFRPFHRELYRNQRRTLSVMLPRSHVDIYPPLWHNRPCHRWDCCRDLFGVGVSDSDLVEQ